MGVSLPRDVYKELKIACFKHEIKANELLEHIISGIVEGEPRFLKMIEEIKIAKLKHEIITAGGSPMETSNARRALRKPKVADLSSAEPDVLFDMLAESDPHKRD